MQTKTVKQNELTSECWSVQVWGLEYCDTCEYLNTAECGGKRIRKVGKNAQGHDIPIGKEVKNV